MGGFWKGVALPLFGVLVLACGGRGSPEVEEERSSPVPSPAAGTDAGAEPSRTACRPTGGGPYWVTEGESLEIAVSCASGLALPAETTLEPLPDGVHFDASTARLRWTPGLAQAAVWTFTLRAGPDDPGSLVVGVADAWWEPENVPVVDPAAYTAEYGVPVLFVEYEGTPTKELRIPAAVTYRGRTWRAGLKLQGETSLEFGKNTYSLKFDAADPFEDREKDFLHRTKIRLTTTFDDNSYVRQRLAYTLWNWMDPAHVQIGVYSVVVFLNGRYWGLYALSDDVDKGLLRISGLNEDGNLYKAIDNNANFQPFLYAPPAPPASPLKPVPHLGYAKKEGLPPEGSPGDFDDLDGFLTWLYGADPFTFRLGFPSRAMQSDFEDYWIFVTALLAGDNLHKNYYLFRDPAGGQWRWIPWDLNGTLGQNWYSGREAPRVSAYAFDNGLFIRFTSDPTLRKSLEARYGRLLRDQWALPKVLALYDAMTAEVRGAALRDQRAWGEAYRTFPRWAARTDFLDHEGEVAYVRSWLEQQWALLLARYP